MDWQTTDDVVDLALVYDMYAERDLGQWISGLLEELAERQHLIDIGTGPGHLLAKYRWMFRDATVVDSDDGMIAACKGRVRGCTFCKGDINGIFEQWQGGKADAIVGCFVSPYVANWSSFLGNVKKVLRTQESRLVLLDFSKTLWTDSREWHREAAGGVVPHVDEPTWGELPTLLNMIHACGFSVVRHRVFENVLRFPDVETFIGYYRQTASFKIGVKSIEDLDERIRNVLRGRFSGMVLDHRYVDSLECVV